MITQEETMMPSRVEPKRNQSDVKNALFTIPSNGKKNKAVGVENPRAHYWRIARSLEGLDALCDKANHASHASFATHVEPVGLEAGDQLFG